MKEQQVTFGHILTILAVLIIPLVIWGATIESRFEQVKTNKESIKKLEKEDTKNVDKAEINHKEIMELLHKIELKVENKLDK